MSMRKTNYKRLLTLVLAMCMLMGVSLTGSAEHSYSFTIPYPYSGSAQHTDLYTKTSTATPYVAPSLNTVSTKYYLAPSGSVSTAATKTETASKPCSIDFTWIDGYGGLQTKYRLVGYPGVLYDYETYNAKGKWSE